MMNLSTSDRIAARPRGPKTGIGAVPAGQLVTYGAEALLARARDLLFPPLCPVSGEPVACHGTLAPSAWARLDQLTAPWCEACGVPFDDSGKGPLCAVCAAPEGYPGHLVGPRRLDRLRAALGYDETAARAILGLKYGDRHDGVKSFGMLMARAARDLLPEEGRVVLVPVPLHPRRLRQRRYNQAGRLAEAVGRELELKVAHGALYRQRSTPTQKGASRRRRTRNVAGAFVLSGDSALADTHILLVDDVLTTGATLLACARVLRRARPASVSGLTLARVLRDVV